MQRDAAYESITKAWGGPSRSIRLRTFRKVNEDEASQSQMDSTFSLDEESLPESSLPALPKDGLSKMLPDPTAPQIEDHDASLQPSFEPMEVESGLPTSPRIVKTVSVGSATELEVLQPKSYTNRFANALINEMDKLVDENEPEADRKPALSVQLPNAHKSAPPTVSKATMKTLNPTTEHQVQRTFSQKHLTFPQILKL
ncbi:hypothetical protein BC829DRAFT_249928 [Chytridium lagenaria]|nr:hypothetical protein BC829DRAFT_249928 [Chytridium lagenaria]